MFSNLTYKKKNRFLLIGVISFLFISYYLSFGKTISLYRENSGMKEQLAGIADASVKADALQKKITELNRMLGGKQLTDTNAQQALLNVITVYCRDNKTVLREFPKAILKEKNDFIVETNFFTVEGDFVKLLSLVYLLEQKERIGRIASVIFQSKRDVRTKALSLSSTIYVQNVKKTANDK